MNTTDRRTFIKSTAAVTAALSASPLLAETAKALPQSETLAATLYKSLSEEQLKAIAFPFDHELRSEVDNNWHITKQRIGQFFTADQQAMTQEIFMNLHSEEYAKDVLHQVNSDNGKGGFGKCAVAFFGKPDTGKFEFVFTGRHVTRRCDGDSVEGAAFGGPIFYGHAAGHNKSAHPGNVYWFQGKRANELFQALDGKQRTVALCDKSRGEMGTKTVALKGKAGKFEGLSLGELAGDQKELAEKVMMDLLAPFRKEDVDESMKYIKAAGMDNLHIAYFKHRDIGDDGIWDMWQIEGPNMVWHFRGAPHVHTWVNIKSA